MLNEGCTIRFKRDSMNTLISAMTRAFGSMGFNQTDIQVEHLPPAHHHCAG